MTQSASNVRVRRTQKLLQEALIGLIEERGFEALTVGELTERALVSRAAFYRNYQDKYDLVEQIFEEAMSALLGAVGELGREHPTESWVKFFEHIAEYDRLYRALLGSKGSPWFVRKMRTRLSDLIKERGRLPHGPDANWLPVHTFSDEFVPDLVSAMFVEAITWWLEQGRSNTVQLRIAQQYEGGRTEKKQTKRRSKWHTEALANLNQERTRLMIVTIPENGLEDKVCHQIDMGLALRA